MNKTHPSVITAIKNLEEELGFSLFDRSGYRSELTPRGETYYKHSKRVLAEFHNLESQAEHLKQGEETALNIVIGDLTPLADVLSLLRSFTEKYSQTRLNLLFDNLYGPNERLISGDADLIVHHIDKSDPRYEFQDILIVPVIPVVAPSFLKFTVNNKIKMSDLIDYTQCVISDTATSNDKKDYFVMPDAKRITVGDQNTKKEVIVQGMAWGHMPLFLIEQELQAGSLISMKGDFMQGSQFEIVVTRLATGSKGIMAERLWKLFLNK